MGVVGLCSQLRDCMSNRFPCLADPGRRSSICLKLLLVVIHMVFLGVVLFADYKNLIYDSPFWYLGLYLLLFLTTLFQYFFTAASSPGYVVDAMRAVNETTSLLGMANNTSASPSPSPFIIIQPATNKTTTTTTSTLSSSLLPTRGPNHTTSNSWTRIVMDMYPPGSSIRQWTCTYCNVLQPPRAKHCHDCDKCVLQFDHHCVWLGTCIGQGNHCRFWWFILEETALCLWTGVLYISYLMANISRSWWIDAVMILLLVTLSICLVFLALLLLFHSYLALTNQTTYEIVRRRRITYLRGIPERVYPFSEGMCKNLYNFCCARSSIFKLERLPTAQEIEAKSRPLMCSDLLCCRCC